MINPSKIADDLKKVVVSFLVFDQVKKLHNILIVWFLELLFLDHYFLAIIAIIPAIAKLSGVNDGFAMFFGGTSLLLWLV